MLHRCFKKIRISTVVFIFAIAILSYYVVDRREISDFGYLLVVIFYFIRFLLLQRKY